MAVTVSIEGVGEQTPSGNITSWDPKTSQFVIVNDDNGRPGSTLEMQSFFTLNLKNGEVKPIFLELPQSHQLKTLRPGDKAWLIMYQEGVVALDPAVRQYIPMVVVRLS